MTNEKPLHVRVAEALGWRDARCMGNLMSWAAKAPREGPGPWIYMDDIADVVPRYDTDWTLTGPLIERYRIDVTDDNSLQWLAHSRYTPPWNMADPGEGRTPLEAVCYFLLGAAKLGNL